MFPQGSGLSWVYTHSPSVWISLKWWLNAKHSTLVQSNHWSQLSGCGKVKAWMTQHLYNNLHTNVLIFTTLYLHLLEHWLGQKSGRTYWTVIARRAILYFRGRPFIPRSRLSPGTTHFGGPFTSWHHYHRTPYCRAPRPRPRPGLIPRPLPDFISQPRVVGSKLRHGPEMVDSVST